MISDQTHADALRTRNALTARRAPQQYLIRSEAPSALDSGPVLDWGTEFLCLPAVRVVSRETATANGVGC